MFQDDIPTVYDLVNEHSRRIIAVWIVGGIFFIAAIIVFIVLKRKHKVSYQFNDDEDDVLVS